LIEQGQIRWWALHRVRLIRFAEVLNRPLSISDIESKLQNFDGAVVRIEVHPDGHVVCCPRRIPRDKQHWSIHWTQREISLDASIKWVDRDAWSLLREQYQVDLLGLLDAQGHYLETCIGNLFIYRPSIAQWLTAPTDGDILPGIMRSVVSVALMDVGESVRECLCQPEEEDELWMSNAVRGVVALGENEHSRRIIKRLNIEGVDHQRVLRHFECACHHG
jgi:branched-subunit amino acid aminotransferase/4-amino-4-deoxychorismate lyase